MKKVFDADLSNCSTMHLAATARELRVLESEADLVSCAPELCEGRTVMLGGGSNVIFAERVERTLLKLSDAFAGLHFIEIPPDWAAGGAGLPGKSVIVRAGAAVPLARLVAEAAARNLAGVEKLAGIPGTVGGAVFMNAGANGGCMADAVLRARVFDARTAAFLDYDRAGLAFSYRHSRLQEEPALAATGVELLLTPAGQRDVKAAVTAYIESRSSSKIKYPNCGSVFRNPPGGVPAGKLIEDAGMKGQAAGALVVSPVHGNYFENHGGATAADFHALCARVREAVLRTSGIELASEVRFLG